MASGLAAGSCALLRGRWVFGASREVTCSGRREGAKGVKCAKGSRYVPTPDLRIAASAGFGFPLSAWEKRDCCRALAAGARTGRCAPQVGPREADSGARGDFGAPAAKCRLQNAKCRMRRAVSFQLSAVSRNAAARETSRPLAGFDSDASCFSVFGAEHCAFQRDATWNHRHE